MYQVHSVLVLLRLRLDLLLLQTVLLLLWLLPVPGTTYSVTYGVVTVFDVESNPNIYYSTTRICANVLRKYVVARFSPAPVGRFSRSLPRPPLKVTQDRSLRDGCRGTRGGWIPKNKLLGIFFFYYNTCCCLLLLLLLLLFFSH